jgi:hypothetical protein
MTESLGDARKELDDEFEEFRKHLQSIHERLDAVDQAGPEDDVYNLLEELEDTVHKVRTGGLLGRGAKGHREARDNYLKLKSAR